MTAQASVHGYHKRLKPYIVEAIQFEKLESNPYDGMRISRGKSEGIKFLTEEERDRVEALELYGMTEKVRDMFIFSCYTGLAYSDLVKIKKSDVFRQGDDYCIRDKRMKTGMPYTIVLLPKAIAILKKYNYDLNLMSNQKCNDQLKIIANLAKLHINLTMRRPPHVCDVGVDKGRGYRDCEQDARPFQRDNDREIRPCASDERHTGLR